MFDFDGTLVDSLELARRAYNQVAPWVGTKQISAGDLSFLQQLPTRTVLKQLGVSPFKLPLVALGTRWVLKHRMPSAPLFPGVKEWLLFCQEQGVTLGLLTTNSRAVVEASLGAELVGVFDQKRFKVPFWGKKRALKKLTKGGKGSEGGIFYVGDESRDGEASRGAKIEFLAVSWGFQSEDELKTVGPTHIFKSPEEALFAFEGNS